MFALSLLSFSASWSLLDDTQLEDRITSGQFLSWFKMCFPWFNFYFSLLLCTVMCDNEYETKENKNRTKGKTEL